MPASIERRILFMRRTSMLLLATTAVFWLTLLDFQGGNSSTATSLRTLSLLAQRPAIYTFRESEEDGDYTQQVWSAAWRSAGYRVEILTIDDAKNHTEVDKYMNIIGKLLQGSDQLEVVKSRFYRYLAMATVGGGLLSEMDVFPLWPLTYEVKRSLAETPEFTVRCGSALKPSSCLQSGSGEEWNRIAMILLKSLEEQHADTSNKMRWSDDHALQELVSFAKGKPLANQESQVLSSEQAYELRPNLPSFRKAQCHTDKLAVRFVDTTPAYLKDWLEQWNDNCVHKLVRGDLSLD
mmetsp:Transcript_10142/g.14888  ORF Transcript_10142/g.14888 Transcript_10142/m.14888 type:complete len:294 (-) Transcript_10142:2391-3272(-)|eukprot:CAMPEP_0194208478 /NCGR_PEP_ID=MMETSP0156-20130528/6914_1 /TAXON_ID=33649 /ORGANISM="Thalassionema nitzschioides, Strain L26-B" /LENGTH=293 /DNA_ID=CAMNT_0038935449 /DNA_START=132 /DNA_END=1013 /DNA_ORIENTATION=-